jgi:mRNA-degrading endonuclease RelE of RelBE toxin-antitoxin system
VRYKVRFAESAGEQLAELSARHRTILLEAVREQLTREPFRETRNRKHLKPNPFAPWELRVGTLRIFYEADAEGKDTVNILAIGMKSGSRLIVAGKEIEL